MQGIAYGFIEAGSRRERPTACGASWPAGHRGPTGFGRGGRDFELTKWLFAVRRVLVLHQKSGNGFSVKAIFLCQLCACFLDGQKIVDSNKQAPQVLRNNRAYQKMYINLEADGAAQAGTGRTKPLRAHTLLFGGLECRFLACRWRANKSICGDAVLFSHADCPRRLQEHEVVGIGRVWLLAAKVVANSCQARPGRVCFEVGSCVGPLFRMSHQVSIGGEPQRTWQALKMLCKAGLSERGGPHALPG